MPGLQFREFMLMQKKGRNTLKTLLSLIEDTARRAQQNYFIPKRVSESQSVYQKREKIAFREQIT
jgi:hypothetical protein